MAQQDDLIGLIKDVTAEKAVPMKKGAYGNPTTDSVAAGYGGGPNANQATPTKRTGTDDQGRPEMRRFFQPLPPEVRHNTDPSDPGGGLDVMAVVFLGGPEGGEAPIKEFKWPVKGSVLT